MKVEEAQRPLIKGEIFLVPCLVKRELEDEQNIWLDIKTKKILRFLYYRLLIILITMLRMVKKKVIFI